MYIVAGAKKYYINALVWTGIPLHTGTFEQNSFHSNILQSLVIAGVSKQEKTKEIESVWLMRQLFNQILTK